MTILETEPLVSPRVGEGAFEAETLTVLMRLREAMGEALAIIPGGVQKSQDIQKRFKLNFKVSWQIYRMMRADHVLEMSPHIPSARPMRNLLEAMQKHGVALEAIAAIEEAYGAFEAHVERYAGDRASFEAMTTRIIGGVTDTQIELSHRRAIFDSYRYVLGYEQNLYVSSMMIYPSAQGRKCVDTIYFRLRQNLRRLRSDIPMLVDATWIQDSEAKVSQQRQDTLPLDEAAYKQYGMYILPEYCSQDMKLTQSRQPNDLMVTKWVAEDVGRLSSVDLAFGQYDGGRVLGPRVRGLMGFNMMTSVITPTRKWIHDVIVPRSAMGAVEFDITHWYKSDIPNRSMELKDMDIQKLPSMERMTCMRGIDGGAIPEVPHYVKMIKQYWERFGGKPEDMVLYRMRADYPLLHVLQQIEVLFPSMSRE